LRTEFNETIIIILGAMTIEVVRLLYSAGLFTPGVLMRWLTLIQVFLPLLDYGTDWFTTGSFHFTKLRVSISLFIIDSYYIYRLDDIVH